VAWRARPAETQPSDGAEEPLPRWGAFAYPHFRRYWFANLSRVFGLQFRFIAAGWLVYQLTGSAIWLGTVGLASAVVTIVLSVPAGVLADRLDNQRLLVVGYALAALNHFAIAVLAVTGLANVWIVLAWAIIEGVLAALTGPSQFALVPRLIDMRVMPSAVALNSAIWNSMRVMGPAAAGVLIAVIGTGQAFFVSAAGFAVASGLMASLRLAPVAGHARGHDDGGMLEGIRYVMRNRLFFATIGLSFFTSVFGQSYVVLLPVFAEDVLGVGPQGFGAMEAAAGVGALLGTLSIVKLGAGDYRGPVMLFAAALFGVLIAAFAASRVLPVSLVLLFLAGFASSVYLNLGMTMLQVLVPDEVRGRVLGVWGMTWFLSSVGGFVAGGIAELLGAPWAVALGALSVTGFAVSLFLTVPSLRHIPRLERPAGARAS